MLGKVLRKPYVPVFCLAALVVCLGAGCPWWFQPQTAKVTTVFTADSGSLKNVVIKALSVDKSVVDVNDIAELWVSIDEIALDRQGTGEDDPGEKVVVYSKDTDPDAEPVNLLDLQEVSRLLSTAEIPADTYTKIRLEISDPHLFLKADDPPVDIDNVKLTAHGHLFIGETFTLEDGDNVLLLLDFGGIHLALNGNGRYVLTPQLHADLTLMDANITATGTIAVDSLDRDNNVFTLILPGDSGEYTVNYVDGVTDIYLYGEPDGSPTGDDTALEEGLEVEVVGLFQVDLSTIDADSIRILTEPPPPSP